MTRWHPTETTNPKVREQYEQATRQDGPNIPAADALMGIFEMKRPSKWRNQPCENDQGEHFDSKLERRRFEELIDRYGPGNIIRQVSLPLEKIVKGEKAERLRPDFMHIMERFEDGSFRVRLLDAKGKATPAWTAKNKHLKDKHGIEIKTI